MKRAGRFLLTALYAILLHLVILSLVLLLTVFRTGFLERESEAYGVAQKLGMSATELRDVTEQMMRYVIRGEEIPEEQEFFNGRELEHLDDIRQMMAVWHLGLGLGMILLVVMSAFCIRRGDSRRICKGYLYSWLWIGKWSAQVFLSQQQMDIEPCDGSADLAVPCRAVQRWTVSCTWGGSCRSSDAYGRRAVSIEKGCRQC